MSSASASATASAPEPNETSAGTVFLPSYELLPTSLLKGIEDAAVAVLTAETISGDLFNISRAVKLPTAEIPDNAIILVPLFATIDSVVMNSDSLAQGPMAYIRLDGPPQPRSVFGTCVAYSEGAGIREVAVGEKVRFPPPTHMLVATPSMVDLIDAVAGVAVDNPRNGETRPVKRLRTRLLEEVGEHAESRDDKGTSKYILDLDGHKHHTRNKTDIAQREKDLGFAFRTVDKDRWEHIMGTDFLLQVGIYKTTIFQQARLRVHKRHESFTSCGYLDRIQDLGFLHRTDQLKLLLTGQIMVEGGAATLSLEDFSNGEKLSSCKEVCPAQNRPMVLVLKNIQTAFQVFLSADFEGVFDNFIEDLEGSERPMELVAADFLRYSVEECLRKFCLAVSSERSYIGILMYCVSEPWECASYLTQLFNDLSDNLSNHQTRAMEEEYYRAHLIREARAASLSSSTPSRTASNSDKNLRSATPTTSTTPTKTCAGHFGGLLKAIYADGRPYKCAFGKTCKFKHIAKAGKTRQEISDIISLLPATAREDLSKTISVKKV